MGEINTKFKEWNKSGIKRFYYMCGNDKKNRGSMYSKDMEIEEMARYEEIYMDDHGYNK